MTRDPHVVLGLGAIAVSLALAYGIWYAYSVFLVALLAEFGWSRSLLAGAFSTFAIVHGLANPVIGVLCDRVRPALMMALGGAALGGALWLNSTITSPLGLYVCFGFVTAIAVAFCGWIPAVVLVQRRHQARLGLALGIVSSGIGVGMLVVVPACQLLIDAWGWRVAWRTTGVACAVCIVPAALYLLSRSGPRRGADLHDAAVATSTAAASGGPRSMTLGEALRTTPFWLMMTAFFFGTLCAQTLHVHQVAYLVDHGLSALVAASVVGAVGLASVIGKTGGGWLSDRVERELVYVAGIVLLVASIGAIVLVGRAPSLTGAYAYAVLLGVGYSATASLIPAMVSDRFRGAHFGAILGMGLFGSAAGSALGPWLAGYLFDVTGSYAVPFSIAAGAGLIAGAAGWIARRLRRARLALA